MGMVGDRGDSDQAVMTSPDGSVCCARVTMHWSSFFFLSGTGESDNLMVVGVLWVEGRPEGVGGGIWWGYSLGCREVSSLFQVGPVYLPLGHGELSCCLSKIRRGGGVGHRVAFAAVGGLPSEASNLRDPRGIPVRRAPAEDDKGVSVAAEVVVEPPGEGGSGSRSRRVARKQHGLQRT